MADNQQQNNGKGQDGGGGKKSAASGIGVSATIEPKELTNKETMAGLFTMLLIGAASVFVLSKTINPIRRKLFGITTEAKVAISANEAVAALKEGAEGSRKWALKECFGGLSKESKDQMKDWVVKQVEPQA